MGGRHFFLSLLNFYCGICNELKSRLEVVTPEVVAPAVVEVHQTEKEDSLNGTCLDALSRRLEALELAIAASAESRADTLSAVTGSHDC